MRFFLNESKRDDLLLPYFELVKDKIPGLTIGKFKGIMLDKLAAQGNINNLSLGSNFYLAGATRYYFQGALTVDKKANLLSGDPMVPDNWNGEACKKLNAVINILRNAYIDTVGTKFEIEEDFGNLSIDKLFRKYGKKINAELGAENGEEQEKKAPELDRNPRVGNGYSFDILYSFADATKYNQATSPGAWCITYGQHHYDYYMRNLGIHYVIFLKDGYENVERKTGEGYTRQKPHDEYGNSMIAYLQKNSSWEPTYITSRWNHGYGDTSGTEADHAYTLEEFCNITGVTPEDLQRIYKIWKTDKKNNNNEESISRSEVKLAMNGALRKLKYAQMMINNGQGPEECILSAGARKGAVLFGNGEQRKSVTCYYISENDIEFTFICDRTNIVFESFSEANLTDFVTANEIWCGEGDNTGKDIIIERRDAFSKIYSVRYHSYIDIDGVKKFKRLPAVKRYINPIFIQVKNSFKDIALLSLSTCKPLKLPNGRCWFNEFLYDDTDSERWRRRNEIFSDVITTNASPIFEIIYDESSREKYFYSWTQRRFLDELNKLKNDPQNSVISYSRNAIQNPADYELRIGQGLNGLGKYTLAFFTPDFSNYHRTDYMILDDKGTPITIYGEKTFNDVSSFCGRAIMFEEYDTNNGRRDYYSRNRKLYDIQTKKLMAVGKDVVNAYECGYSGRYITGMGVPRFFTLTPKGNEKGSLIYDTNVGLFIKNPFYKECRLKSPWLFNIEDSGNSDGTEFTIYKDYFDFWERYRQVSDVGGRDRYDMVKKEEASHIVDLLTLNLEYFPNNLPVNDENSLETKKHQSTQEINEKVIREAVMNAIKNIIK